MHSPGLTAAIRDGGDAIALWRSWSVLAVNDVRQRYRRSLLGQFWLTISMAATIAGLALVFSSVFRQPLTDYLPYLAVGIITWNLVAGLIGEAAGCFIRNEVYLKSYAGPRAIAVMRALMASLITSAHNLVLMPVLWLTVAPPPTASLLLFPLALLLVLLNAGWFALLVGPLAARFRDVGQIVQNVLQVLFFMTPVIYRKGQVDGLMSRVAEFNPLTHVIEILRAPLLGETPATIHFVIVAAMTVAGYLIAIPIYAETRSRVVYWL